MQYFNFSAGPSTLFPEVIEQIKNDIGNWNNTHCSVFEYGHRTPEFTAFAKQMEQDLRDLLNIPDDYAVLFLHGGGRGGFDTVPLNMPQKHKKALYLISGHWSRESAKQAEKYIEVKNAAYVDDQFKRTKNDWTAESADCDYVYYCSNETIEGIETFDPPVISPNAYLVCDMSSDILSRPVDVSKFDVIYAGAQKNIGASGVAIYIVKKSLLGFAAPYCPEIFDWKINYENDSMYNTPATFSWYTCALTFQHLKKQFGNLANLEQVNINKANHFYNYLDQQDYYSNRVDPAVRSRMIVSFTTGNAELDTLFVQQAKQAGLLSLKGHRVYGGLRAAFYNAVSFEAVKALIAFMQDFAQKNPK
ncbi:3-phosphoserine/phosphohydroxythreonine transaminase [Psittacicella hinzii]|nr:3-phosphoserine/phosphohydroxythreonine transaminase [Psittacicella hinzii]